MWDPDNQYRKKLNLCMLLQANKNILFKNEMRIKKSNENTKYVLTM